MATALTDTKTAGDIGGSGRAPYAARCGLAQLPSCPTRSSQRPPRGRIVAQGHRWGVKDFALARQ